ncbi:MAG: InlB B-repeat-containing protein [Clostridiaceae bacterium]|jgi:uncharacterized repeat protein (TIGR02543 family)|nr:InlB B-repeat-containing protein [Clostridiaceae bacterium]
MKRFLSLILCLFLALCLLSETALAADSSRSYEFVLTADGSDEMSPTPGQVITVTLALNRTDSDQPADMYAAQAELYYDDAFYELVEGSITTYTGVEWTHMTRRTGGGVIYLNFLSLTGGEKWDSKVQMGSFQLRVIAENGASKITSQNCLVSLPDGSGQYSSVSNDVQTVVSTDCTVTFECGGGSEVPDQIVQYGEKIIEPEEPVREDYTFSGWYADLDKTDLWDFTSDTVQGNMTLYAGWLSEGSPSASAVQNTVENTTSNNASNQDDSGSLKWLILPGILLGLLLILFFIRGKKKVTFDSCGGTAVEPIYVKRNSLMNQPMPPTKADATFVGWYTEAQSGTAWDFDQNRVNNNMTLYARWQ